MREFSERSLHSGGSGAVVTDRKQAVAICLRLSGQSKQPQPTKGKRR